MQMVYLVDLLMDSGKAGLPYRFEIWIQTAQNRQFFFARAFGARGLLTIRWWGSARKTNPCEKKLLVHFEYLRTHAS